MKVTIKRIYVILILVWVLVALLLFTGCKTKAKITERIHETTFEVDKKGLDVKTANYIYTNASIEKIDYKTSFIPQDSTKPMVVNGIKTENAKVVIEKSNEKSTLKTLDTSKIQKKEFGQKVSKKESSSRKSNSNVHTTSTWFWITIIIIPLVLIYIFRKKLMGLL